MIVYIENPIISTKKLLDLINEFGKVAGYEVNIQKFMAFLYTNIEFSEKETKKKSHLYSNQKTKVPGKNLTKEVKDLHSENYTTLKKKILGNIQINGSIYHVHGLEELTSLKCPYYPKLSIDSMQFPLQYQWHTSQI